jgi:photosystem II stability/assembly factor-like uncharacterized protein
MSSDGMKLAALGHGDKGSHIYASSDSGVTWSEKIVDDGTIGWGAIAISGNGQKLFYIEQYIWVSTDLGNTWSVETEDLGLIRSWMKIISSYDGSEIAVVESPGFIYISSLQSGNNNTTTVTPPSSPINQPIASPTTSTGTTTTDTTSSSNSSFVRKTNFTKNWISIAMSSDGSKLAAAEGNPWARGNIWLSPDFGDNWTEKMVGGVPKTWTSIAISSNGTKLAAVDEGYPNGGYIYTSSDSGATWVERSSAGLRYWGSIAMSSDGERLAALDYKDGDIYISSDSGLTWTPRIAPDNRDWWYMAMSSDGIKLAAVGGNSLSGSIYTSSDSGATWVERSSAGLRNWGSIVMSSDGEILAALTFFDGLYDSNIYISTDFGGNWSERVVGGGTKRWNSITMSGNGQNLIATMYLEMEPNSQYILVSTDVGITWSSIETENLEPKNWGQIVSSYDGSKLAVVESPGFIYISTSESFTVAPTLLPTPILLNISETDSSNIIQKNKIMKRMQKLENLFLLYVNLTGLFKY